MNVAFLLPFYDGRNHSPFLGVGYLSQSLKQNGFSTCILDEDAIVFVMEQRGSSEPFESSRQFIFDYLVDFAPDAIALTINTTNYQRSLDLLRFVRMSFPEVFVLVGGPHITTSWATFRKYHSFLFDAAVVGEGEETIIEVCSHLKNRTDWRKTKGCIASSEYEHSFFPRPLVQNLDSLPFPDRDGFFSVFPTHEKNLLEDHYKRVFYNHLPGFRKQNFCRIVASRGCNFACDFCSPSVCWKNPETGKPERRLRTPENLVDEIEFLTKSGYMSFYFDDPTFPFMSRPDFIKRFLSEIEARKLQISWAAPTRYDELTEDILEKLAYSGFTYTYFGLETYRNDCLNNMGKPTDVERSLRVISLCEKYGIHCDVSWQIGLPGDSLQTIIDDIKWLEDKGLQKRSFFSIAAIWPETALAEQYGITSEDFEPEVNKTEHENRGLFFFPAGDQRIERFFSNCSGTFHFINVETAIKVKYYLMDAGFIKRFGDENITNK